MQNDQPSSDRPASNAWIRRLFLAVRVALGASGVALAYAGQAFLKEKISLPVGGLQRPTAGGLVMLLGGLLFGLAMPWPVPESVDDSPPGEGFRIPRPRLLLAAVAAYAAAMGTYLSFGENPGVWIGWVLAPLCLLAACYQRSTSGPESALARWIDCLLPLGVILPVALALRLWHLDTLPLALSGDQVTDGFHARQMLHGETSGVIGFAWDFTPRVGFLWLQLSMAAFGDNLFGLNMSSVVSGMLSLISVYLLGAELYGRRVGWLASGLLAISHTNIHFSRVPHVIDPVPWFTFALYYLVRGIRTQASKDSVLAGVTAGIALQMYYAGRTVVLAAGLLFVFLIVRRRLKLRQWVIFVAAVVFTLGPMVAFYARHWEELLQRTRTVSIFNSGIMAHLQYSYGKVTPAQVVLESAKRAFLTFPLYENKWVERNIGRPFLDGFTAPLLALGFVYALLRPRRMGNWLLSSSFILIVFLTLALTSDPPWWQRSVTVMPVVALLAALALDRIVELFKLPRLLCAIVLLLVLARVGWDNWTQFVQHESLRVGPLSLGARYAATLPPDRCLVILRPPWQPEWYEFRFLAPQVPKFGVTAEDALAGRWPSLPGPPAILVAERRPDVLDAARAAWPGGVVREFRLPRGDWAFSSYEAPPLPEGSR